MNDAHRPYGSSDPHWKARNTTRNKLLLSALAALMLGACAAESPVKSADIERKIDAARTRADHQEIAAIYDRRAQADGAAAEQHRALARAYERGAVWTGPQVGTARSVEALNRSQIAHCEDLARIYQRAAEENLALARAHRQIAASLKD